MAALGAKSECFKKPVRLLGFDDLDLEVPECQFHFIVFVEID